MGFVVTCESCEKRLSIPAPLYEKKVRGRVVTITCRSCQAIIRIDATLPPPPANGPVSSRRAPRRDASSRRSGLPSSRAPDAPRPSRRPDALLTGSLDGALAEAPASSARPDIVPNSRRPTPLSPPDPGLLPSTYRPDFENGRALESGAARASGAFVDAEFPSIPRAPALPEVAAPASQRFTESDPFASLEARADSPPAGDESTPGLDDGWDEVPEDAISAGSLLALRSLNPSSGVLSGSEEQTHAEPSAAPDAAAEAPVSFPEDLGLRVAEPEPARLSSDSLDHVDGPISTRLPIGSIGRYTMFDKFATGGMATVHLGRLDGAGGFSRVVALKRLLPHLVANSEFVEMLLKEARLAGRVRHPNVVPTLDVVASRGDVVIVLEYVQGESLSALCRSQADRQELIDVEIAVSVVLGALRGLHAVHEATDERGRPLGLVHRDVSPANVIVGVDGLARVLDFGIVKALELVEETIPNRLKGKTGYMSPEQARGERVTRRSDVFSAGILLWEVLTLRRFAAAKTDKERLDRILSGKYEPPSFFRPELSIDLDAVVMKALAFDPEDRFATAREFAEALESVTGAASAGAVADWVNRLAEKSLAERARSVAQVENWTGNTHEAELSSTPFAAEVAVLDRMSYAPRDSRVPAEPAFEHASPEPRSKLFMEEALAAQAKRRSRLFSLPVLAAFAVVILIVYWFARGG